MIIPKSIHVAINVILNSFMADKHSIVYMYHVIFISLFIDDCLDCFHVLAIVYSAIVNIEVPGSFQIRVFFFSRYMPRSGTVG